MSAKPIKTGFFTCGRGQKRPSALVAGNGQDAEKPIAARFFTLGSMGKNSYCRKLLGSLGTRSPFREACRNCHNPPPQPGGEKIERCGGDRMPLAAPMDDGNPAQGRRRAACLGGNLAPVLGVSCGCVLKSGKARKLTALSRARA